MIKPFKILSVRDEPDGAKTVFFEVTKVAQESESKNTATTMRSAIYVDAGLDVDAVLYNNLKVSGWIDA
jgi:hypothetical protein